MDSTLYEDHVVGGSIESLRSDRSSKQLKSQLTLDFKNASQQKYAPGLSNLTIDSPDFEKFISSQSEQFVSSSTPTTQILFPKLVTEEQEAYARGFIDALEELHKRQGVAVAVNSTNSPVNSAILSVPKLEQESSLEDAVAESKIASSSAPKQLGSVCSVPMPISISGGTGVQLFTVVGMPSVSQGQSYALAGGYVVSSSLPSTLDSSVLSANVDNRSVVIRTINNQSSTLAHGTNLIDDKFQMPINIMALKSFASRASQGLGTSLAVDTGRFSTASCSTASACLTTTDEPQTVPCLDSGLCPSSSDVIVERKRARNRVAAQKCRMRKIERIEELSDRVREIRSENERLSQVSAELRKQISDLKREILSHVSSGCRVMAGSSIQS